MAGRFDHYICRRDDSLRDRAPDEVPRLQAAALRAAGVPDRAISIIPDEQEAVDAALNMGEAGDLLLVFADALVRSWKQITKFKPASAVTSASPDAAGKVGRGPGEGLSPMPNPSPQPTLAATAEGTEKPSVLNLDGMIRDERGIRYAPETED